METIPRVRAAVGERDGIYQSYLSEAQKTKALLIVPRYSRSPLPLHTAVNSASGGSKEKLEPQRSHSKCSLAQPLHPLRGVTQDFFSSEKHAYQSLGYTCLGSWSWKTSARVWKSLKHKGCVYAEMNWEWGIIRRNKKSLTSRRWPYQLCDLSQVKLCASVFKSVKWRLMTCGTWEN